MKQNCILMELPTLIIFSYLSGGTLVTKIAVLNKKWRKKLPLSALLDQLKILTLKTSCADNYLMPNVNSFKYASTFV